MSVIKTLIRFYIIQVFWLFYGPIHIAVFSSTFHLFYFFERETEIETHQSFSSTGSFLMYSQQLLQGQTSQKPKIQPGLHMGGSESSP